MRKHITLVGIDYSNHSKIALETAMGIARAAKGELHVVHVIAASYGAYPSDTTLKAEVYAKTENEFIGWLVRMGEDTKQRLPMFCGQVLKEMSGLTLGHVRLGRPDRELVLLAEELKADLLVVGTHGRTGLERVFLGSVAERVMRTAPCPVLVARPREPVQEARIESPCPDCIEIRKATKGSQTWCARHATHHPRAHTYSEYPKSFGLGALTFRV